MLLQEYILAIDDFVGGELPLGAGAKTLAVKQALQRYSKDKPRIVAEDETGDGGFDYALTLLADWSDGFSNIIRVEYPVDDGDQEADVLDDEQWTIYQKPAGKVLRFTDEKPAASESFRVTYSALHTCTASACTVKAFDEVAVQALAAAYFCEMLATWYAQSTDSTMGADVVDHRSQADQYARRAASYRSVYFKHMGVKEGAVRPVSATQDWDVNYPGGTDRLTHPRRQR